MCMKIGIHSRMCIHRSFSSRTFIKSCSKQKMYDWWVAKDFDTFLNECFRRLYFHTVCTPSELSIRRRVASPNKVRPKCLICSWNQFNNFDRQATIFNVQLQTFDEPVNVIDDWRCFNQRVDTGDEDALLIANRRG